MMHLDFLLSAIVVFLGLVVGAILAFIAPEELKPGEKYFSIFRRALLLSITIIFAYQYFTEVWLILLMVVFIGYSFYLFHFAKQKSKERMIYFLLGFILFLAYKDRAIFLIQSTIIFLYGLPEGTLFAKEFIKNKRLFVVKKLFLCYWPFLLTSLLPSILFEF